MVRAAETLAGRYELLSVIGRGGMGVVYRARDRILDRIVAVKVLPGEYAEDRTLVERFEREARAVARLSHPNIVAVFDTGRDASVRYIVMELVPGVSLAGLLRERGALGVPEALEIAAQIASALAAAHAAGIVHRDIKPGNVMVQPSGTSKVLDFGIARATADGALTRTTTVLGSAPYIAPEVVLGGSADERSDIYSLGCVLYEMLTGRPPFVGDLPAAVMSQQTSAAPEPPRELEPAIPGALDALVMQTLAKRPTDRPQHAAQLGPALRASFREPALPAAAAARMPPGPAPVSESTHVLPPRRSPRRAWIALGAAIVALLVGFSLWLVGSSGSGRQRTTTVPQRQTPTAPGASSTSGSSQTSPASSTPTTAPRSTTTTTAPASTATTTTTPTTSSTTTASTTAPATSSTAPATGTATPP